MPKSPTPYKKPEIKRGKRHEDSAARRARVLQSRKPISAIKMGMNKIR